MRVVSIYFVAGVFAAILCYSCGNSAKQAITEEGYLSLREPVTLIESLDTLSGCHLSQAHVIRSSWVCVDRSGVRDTLCMLRTLPVVGSDTSSCTLSCATSCTAPCVASCDEGSEPLFFLHPIEGLQCFEGRLYAYMNQAGDGDRRENARAWVLQSLDSGRRWSPLSEFDCLVSDLLVEDSLMMLHTYHHSSNSDTQSDSLAQRVLSLSRDGGVSWEEVGVSDLLKLILGAQIRYFWERIPDFRLPRWAEQESN